MSIDKKILKTMSNEEKKAYLKKLLLEKKDLKVESQSVNEIESFQGSSEFIEFSKRASTLSKLGVADLYFNETEGISKNIVTIKGKEVINYSCYNYVGLSGHERVSKAAKDAIDNFGTSASASRIASGQKSLHRDLEKEISGFLGTEDAIALVGGYSTNETIIGHMMSDKDLILYDSYIHESIQQGSRLSGASIKPFPHNRFEALETILKEERHKYEKVLIVIEGVYSMDGDIPDLPEFIRIKKEYKSMLMVDEAHSMGVIGKTGRGISEYHNVDVSNVDLWMGTLSKAFSSCGGYIAGPKEIIDYIKYTCPGFVYSVGMTPADAAAAKTAIEVLSSEPERVQSVQENSKYFLESAKSNGWNTGHSKDSAVVPLIIGDSEACINLYHTLFEKGIFVIPIIHPAVPENAARLRFFINSTHTKEQLDKTVDSLKECLN